MNKSNSRENEKIVLTKPLSEALNIPAPPEAKLTPFRKDMFLLEL